VKNNWRNTALMVSVLVGISQMGPVFADQIQDKQRQLQDVQQRMQEQANTSHKAKRQADTISAQLQAIQFDLDQAEGDLNTIQTKLDAIGEQVRVNTELVEKAEKMLAERNTILHKRIRDVYENGNISYVEVLFGAKDFSDFTNRLELLRRVITQDMALIEKVKVERQIILEKKAQLEQDKAVILVYKEQAAGKRNTVDTKRQERQDMLDNVLTEKETADRAYAELEQTSRDIEYMIQNLQNPASRGQVRASGVLIWPFAGEITSPFGWRIHPVFGTQKFHTGIDLGADYGDPIKAADSGVVIHADWLGGYGKAVIIDHGNGLQTLYAHNSELVVSNGQTVRKGQLISRAGSTGYSTGPHLHFEVRRNGSPTDPMGYLP
jgi:murein DD-endopeptidase MepM/ murein hydrolase activator NlpD